MNPHTVIFNSELSNTEIRKGLLNILVEYKATEEHYTAKHITEDLKGFAKVNDIERSTIITSNNNYIKVIDRKTQEPCFITMLIHKA